MKNIFISADRELLKTESEQNGKYPSDPKGPQKGWNPLFPLALGVVANVVIWGGALLFIKVSSPTYTSDFAVSLPVTGTSTNINLPGIGQASSFNESPYKIPTQDPRENYKFIVSDEAVLSVAANSANIPLEKFGKPRIEIVDNTTLMKIEIKGDNPEDAKNKATVLYNAFESRLNELRNQEAAKQDLVLKSALTSAQEKLKAAEKRLSEYKASSGLSSTEQLSHLSTNIEQLRRQKSEVLAQQQQADSTVRQLSADLNLSAQEAADAFTLQTDATFQKYVQDYSLSNATFVSSSAKFLPTHPAVIEEKAKQDAALAALLNRANFLLGRPVTQATLAQLNLSNSNSQSSASNRASLAQQLVASQAELQGLQAQAQALDRQLTLLENRHKSLAQKEVNLEDLKRDVQIAEAVFSSTLAKLDLAKSNIFASYPQIHLLAPPNLPATATAPKKQFVIIGAGLGSIFCTSGLLLLWLRKRKPSRFQRIETIPPDTKQLRAG